MRTLSLLFQLLSLAGRSSVLVCGVLVVLQQLEPCPLRGPGIDMEQVQCLVKEMGTSLSPGAQNLMDMVQFQQKVGQEGLSSPSPQMTSAGYGITADVWSQTKILSVLFCSLEPDGFPG